MHQRQYTDQEKLNIVRRIVVEKPDMMALSRELDLPQGKLFAWKNQYQNSVYSQIRRKTKDGAETDRPVPQLVLESTEPKKERKKNRYLTKEEKLEALQLLADGNSAEEVALAYDVSQASLVTWRVKFGDQKVKPAPQKPAPVVKEVFREDEVIRQPIVPGQPYYPKKPIPISPVVSAKPIEPAKVPDFRMEYEEQLRIAADLTAKLQELTHRVKTQAEALQQQESEMAVLRQAGKQSEVKELRDIIANLTLEVYRLKSKK